MEEDTDQILHKTQSRMGEETDSNLGKVLVAYILTQIQERGPIQMEEGLHQEIKVLHDGKNEARRDLAAKQKDIKVSRLVFKHSI